MHISIGMASWRCLCSEVQAGPFTVFISQRQEVHRHVTLSKKSVWPWGIFSLLHFSVRHNILIQLGYVEYSTSAVGFPEIFGNKE